MSNIYVLVLNNIHFISNKSVMTLFPRVCFIAISFTDFLVLETLICG